MSRSNTALGAIDSPNAYARAASAAGPHVVELRDLSVSFGEKQVLNAVSLAVDPQERLVIIGQSGAGKTTILRLILGILMPTAGQVFFKQHDISRFTPNELEAMRIRLGMVYQDAALLSSLTVRENLALPLQELTNKTPADIDRIVDEKLEMVEMTGEDKLLPFEPSGGMRKRVGLARALVMEPELILFDEPTQGLDPVIAALIDELIIDLTKRTKTTSIIVTHLMDSAFRIATRMAMLHRGKIIEEGTPEEMRQSKNPVVVQFSERQHKRADVGAQQISHAVAGRLDGSALMSDSRHRRKFAGIAIVYVAVIAIVLYPALHEGLGTKLFLWNCIPPTLGLLLITTAVGKSRPRVIASAIFALLAAAVTTFFSAAWFFTPLDIDPHSAATRLVFIFAPVFSLGLATIAFAIAWFVARVA
jgi:phospholipid/cholesterol/gamma-HCH transport system ATP-binding protein